MEAKQPSLAAVVGAEALGTFMLVLFGCGAVHSAVLSSSQSGLWQVAIVWGISIMLACFVVGGVSGAHLNPAVTIGMAAWGKFPSGRVIPYIVGQMAGAFVAAAFLYGAWGPLLEAKEKTLSLERGTMDSVMTAMCYGEYFPNPGTAVNLPRPDPYEGVPPKNETTREEIRKTIARRAKDKSNFENYLFYVPHGVAFGIEVVGTMILALVICATTDDRNRGAPAQRFAPVFIGLTVAALVSIIAPLTQACFNPARDWGPRIFAYLAGWGEAAIPGPNGIGSVTVYILAPIVGGILGVGLYERVVRSWLAQTGSQ